jgi:hypothetical protein
VAISNTGWISHSPRPNSAGDPLGFALVRPVTGVDLGRREVAVPSHRAELHLTGLAAGAKRRFAPHELRHAQAVEM